ncbi:MAG TPA: hypothetical protein VL500_01635 [Candidatus Eisenbacteria bacterium]|nr:hypothetical protein [Candidatus Eisenbacteria bacterium]
MKRRRTGGRYAGAPAEVQHVDPFAVLDSFAEIIADSVAEAMMKTALVAGAVGLTAVCLAVILTRKTRG